jgi:hypothetical protein
MYTYVDDLKTFADKTARLERDIADLIKKLDGPKVVLTAGERSIVRAAAARRLHKLFDKFIAEFETGHVDQDSLDEMTRIAHDLKD